MSSGTTWSKAVHGHPLLGLRGAPGIRLATLKMGHQIQIQIQIPPNSPPCTPILPSPRLCSSSLASLAQDMHLCTFLACFARLRPTSMHLPCLLHLLQTRTYAPSSAPLQGALVPYMVREHNHVPVLFGKGVLGCANEEVRASYRDLARGPKISNFSVSSGEVTFCPFFCW